MDTKQAGQDVTVSFVLEDGVNPSALAARVLDEANETVVSWTPVPLPAAGEPATFVVVAANNQLKPAEGVFKPAQARAARIVELRVTAGGTDTYLEEMYVITAGRDGSALVVGVNTFQTHAQALIGCMEFAETSLAGWTMTEGDRKAQEAALSEAYARIVMLPIAIEFDNDQSVIRDVGNRPPRLRDLTPTQLLNTDPRLLRGLRQAQIVEADAIMSGDQIASLRKQGIQSMTVGESSQFFGATKPLDIGITPAAAQYLRRWIRFGVSLQRR